MAGSGPRFFSGSSGAPANGPVKPWPTAPIIAVRNLNHYFGEGQARNQVLFDVQLEVWPGQIIILTGPSGAGKTTLLTLIGALRSIQDGSVEVLGRELAEMDPEELPDVREDIGFIFQAHNLFASLTAHQTVLMALELKAYSRGERHRRATEILTLLGLGKHLHQKPGTLSGGQKQRVAIARALANSPRLILADEPTAALDEKTGRDVVTLLQKLAREEGCTSLLVSHEPRIFDVADRLITMEAGRITSDVWVWESMTVLALLGKYPDFAPLPPDVLSGVAAKTVEEKYPAGSIIFREGDVGNTFYLIRKGSADVLVSEGEKEKLIGTLKAGEFFGETSLLTGQPRSATVRAREDIELFALDRVDFQAALAARSRTGL